MANDHIAHYFDFAQYRRQHVQALYKELLKDVPGVHLHEAPSADYDSNYWLCTITIDPEVKVKGQEDAYKEVIKTAVGGAAGVIHAAESATTDCQPNENVEAMRVFMLQKKVEARPVWKPMHCQPVYRNGAEVQKVQGVQEVSGVSEVSEVLEGPKMAAYLNGVSEAIFKVGMCIPAGPYVTDEDVHYIVDCIKEAISK